MEEGWGVEEGWEVEKGGEMGASHHDSLPTLQRI